MRRSALLAAPLFFAACRTAAPAGPVYEAVAVERRDIVVSARANGTVQPDTTVEVKSQASGEVLQVLVETGRTVRRGEFLIRIDPRIPRNNMDLAQSNLDVAQARLDNARTQRERAEELLKSQSITQAEYDAAQLDYATARAGVVSARVNLQNARITLDQTDVRAPITGTVIDLAVERGQIISSPMNTVGEGTVLLKMADLNRVQVSTLVDETDIGKIRAGLRATVTVDAYPNRPFEGEVLKIEPQAVVQQNVTMFPVLVRIQNREGLLKPGMNSEVEIHVGRRDGVLAVPNASLRTQRDVSSAVAVLGLDLATVQAELARAGGRDSGSPTAARPEGPGPAGGARPAAGGGTMTMPDGRTITLPAGVTEAQLRRIREKRMAGEELTADERALMRRVFQGMGAGGGRGGDRPGGPGAGGGRPSGGPDPLFGGRYIVFVRRDTTVHAMNVTTGITDLDWSEVVSGVAEGDSVLVLPSASLVQSQQEFKSRMQRMTGGGIPGMRAQTPGGTSAGGGRP